MVEWEERLLALLAALAEENMCLLRLLDGGMQLKAAEKALLTRRVVV